MVSLSELVSDGVTQPRSHGNPLAIAEIAAINAS